MKERCERGRGKRSDIWERIGKRFEVDADMIRCGERIEIRGQSRAEVSGVRRIVSYTDTRVVLLLNRGMVSVEGENLECVFYRRGEAGVEGKLRAVRFDG